MKQGRWSRRALIVLLVSTAIMVQSGAAAAAHSIEPWYTDMGGHWSEPYVRLLWDESVSIASIHTSGNKTYYQPEKLMQRDAWLVTLVRVFGLPESDSQYFRDVSWPHYINYTSNVYRELNAAGWAGYWSKRNLWPELFVTRQIAASTLIRNLGLTNYAQSLSSSQISTLLAPFSDRGGVDTDLRPFVAAAIQLKIIEGYPDRTLKPKQDMRRSEGATMIARSALIRALATPNPFSPDGDGFEDETVITLRGLRNRNMTRWSLVITDDREREVWSTGATTSQLPALVTWTGLRSNGTALPAGTYYYQVFLRDTQRQDHATVRMPITLLYRHLTANLTPDHVFPGDFFAVTAATSGDVRRVIFDWAGGTYVLSRQGSTWQGQRAVPAGTPAGTYPVTVTAEFPGINHNVVLWLEVEARTSLTGWLEPDPVNPGGILTISATTEGPVQAVTALFEDGAEIQLAADGPDHWLGHYEVSPGAAPRLYTVHLTAHGINRNTTLTYQVRDIGLDQVRVVLTD